MKNTLRWIHGHQFLSLFLALFVLVGVMGARVYKSPDLWPLKSIECQDILVRNSLKLSPTLWTNYTGSVVIAPSATTGTMTIPSATATSVLLATANKPVAMGCAYDPVNGTVVATLSTSASTTTTVNVIAVPKNQ